MAHFAEIVDGVVTRVLYIDNEHEHRGEDYLANELGLGGEWVQTSYSSSFRRKFAGPGDTYDAATDAFYPPQPYPSWVLAPFLDDGWMAPVEQPEGDNFEWDEKSLTWTEKVGD